MNWKTEAAVDLALALALTLWITAAHAEQVCQSVYNPMSGRWEYQCVERGGYDRSGPVCHQEYDPMNQVWVTVCN